MVHITAKLAVVYCGDKELTGIRKGPSYPVIGYKVEKRKTQQTGEEFDSYSWIVVNDNARISILFPSVCNHIIVSP